MPELSAFESPSIVQIPAEMIKPLGRTIFSEIHKVIHCIWNKEELPEDWKELIIVPNYKKDDKIGCSNYPLSYRVPVRERYGSTLLPATREQHDQNCTQSH